MKLYLKILLVVLLLLLDQAAKYAAIHFLIVPIKILPFFSLYYTKNTGIAFSLPFPPLILIIATFLFLLGVGFFLFRKKHGVQRETALSFLLAGGIGNLIDRVFVGGVIDFLSFWSFPIFNLADTFITVGIALWIFGEVFGEE